MKENEFLEITRILRKVGVKGIIRGNTLEDILLNCKVDIKTFLEQKEEYEKEELVNRLIESAYKLYNNSIPLLKSLILGREPTKTEEDGLNTKFLLAKIVAGRDPQKLESLSFERGQTKEDIVSGMRVDLEDFYSTHKKEKGGKAQKTLEDYAHYVCNVGAGWKVTEGKFHILGMNFRDKILEFIKNKEFERAIDMFNFTKNLKAVGETKEERVLDILTKTKGKIDED